MKAPYRAQIVAVGSALPERRLTNADLERMVETTDEWIVTRTGIRERRIAEPGQGLMSLAVPASIQCLERAGVAAEAIDGIIVATISGDYVMPSTANLLQHRLKAAKAWGFDLLNACNGFVTALATASAFIEAGRAKRILVVGGDVMSTLIDYRDRNTCILFGDGCGAVLLEAGPIDGPGIIGCELHSDGAGGDDLNIPCSGSDALEPGDPGGGPALPQAEWQSGLHPGHPADGRSELQPALFFELGMQRRRSAGAPPGQSADHRTDR